MSSPIAIPRATSSSASSPASSPASASLYVPVHKRTGSTSNGSGSSSRSTSPSSARLPGMFSSTPLAEYHTYSPSPEAKPKQHPRIYTTDFLFTLRAHADESVKDKMRELCPEVVMKRKMRKTLEFMEHQRVKSHGNGYAAFHSHAHAHEHGHPHPQPAPHHEQHSPQRQHHALPIVAPTPAPVVAPKPIRTSAPAAPTRVLPRRSRPAARGPESRRQALQSMSASASAAVLSDTWRGMRVQPLSVL